MKISLGYWYGIKIRNMPPPYLCPNVQVQPYRANVLIHVDTIAAEAASDRIQYIM